MRRSRRPDRSQSLNSIDCAQNPGDRAIGGAYALPARVRSDELVVRARRNRGPDLVEGDEVAEGERRQSRHPSSQVAANAVVRDITAVDAPRLVGALEAAVTEPAQQDVLASAEDDEIDDAVAVELERVRAGHVGEVGCGVGQGGELQRSRRSRSRCGTGPPARFRPPRTARAGRRRRSRTRRGHRPRRTASRRRTYGPGRSTSPRPRRGERRSATTDRSATTATTTARWRRRGRRRAPDGPWDSSAALGGLEDCLDHAQVGNRVRGGTGGGAPSRTAAANASASPRTDQSTGKVRTSRAGATGGSPPAASEMRVGSIGRDVERDLDRDSARRCRRCRRAGRPRRASST